jgi:broad specificity phosphatase PhoE
METTIHHIEPGIARIGAAPGPRLIVTHAGVILISRANLGGRPIRDLEAAAREWPDLAPALRVAGEVRARLPQGPGNVSAREGLQ